MEQRAPYNVAVSVTPAAREFDPQPAEFGDRAPVQETLDLEFVIATYSTGDRKGLMARCITVSQNDRSSVASTIAGWVADGLRVTTVGVKEMRKHLSTIAAITKAEADAAEAAAAKTAGESGANADAPVQTNDSAPAPAAAPAVEGGVDSEKKDTFL
jgi:hypothetical protein